MLFCLAGLALGASGCGAGLAPSGTSPSPEPVTSSTPVEEPVASTTPLAKSVAAGMANPASVYCEENGGVLKIQQDSTGGERGICIFPDGSECDEWAYFRGECPQGSPGETPQAMPTPTVGDYAFPAQIDPAGRYLFYLHGKIIEDQGLPAVSPDYGEYQYGAILQALSEHGFRVISEVRPKDTDPLAYAQHVAGQVDELLAAGVPAENITVVGASKGGGIAIYVSNLVGDEKVNYVPMAICSPETVAELIQTQVALHGNVLSIYDASDEFAGSCAELFAFSAGKGLGKHEEIVLNVGPRTLKSDGLRGTTGHGILYQPLDEWVLPVVAWAGGD